MEKKKKKQAPAFIEKNNFFSMSQTMYPKKNNKETNIN